MTKGHSSSLTDCMKEVCKLLTVLQSTITFYHPMCNGLVEKFNGILKKMLRNNQSSGTVTSMPYVLRK